MQEQNIISSLVELTRLRDQRKIRGKLLSALIEITDAAWIVMCRLHENDGQYHIDITDRIPNPSADKAIEHFPRKLFEDHGIFVKTLATGNPSWVEDSDVYQAIIFNAPGSARYNDFVIMFDDKVSGRAERMIASILALYDNFLTLMIENTQDPLTRLFNRGAFDIDLPAVLIKMNEQPERRCMPRPGQKRSFLAMFDLDHFKRINDNFGHLYGDEVILVFASILRETLGDCDKVYRYGGEEFSAIIDQVTIEEMQDLMQQVRRNVEAYRFPQVGQVTVSIGVAELRHNSLPSTLLDFADQALYQAKDQGRNRVNFYHDSNAKPAAESDATDTDDVFF